jgi:hemoglobin
MFRLDRFASIPAVSALTAFLLLSSLGCQNSKTQAPPSLYVRLGGEKGITAVVDSFVAKVSADPAINFTRVGHPTHWEPSDENIVTLKKHLVQFVEANTGGSQKYEGRDMAAVHSGMAISQAEWEAAVADLKSALSDNNVAATEQNELLQIVATSQASIVGK